MLRIYFFTVLSLLVVLLAEDSITFAESSRRKSFGELANEQEVEIQRQLQEEQQEKEELQQRMESLYLAIDPTVRNQVVIAFREQSDPRYTQTRSVFSRLCTENNIDQDKMLGYVQSQYQIFLVKENEYRRAKQAEEYNPWAPLPGEPWRYYGLRMAAEGLILLVLGLILLAIFWNVIKQCYHWYCRTYGGYL